MIIYKKNIKNKNKINQKSLKKKTKSRKKLLIHKNILLLNMNNQNKKNLNNKKIFKKINVYFKNFKKQDIVLKMGNFLKTDKKTINKVLFQVLYY